MEKHGAKFAGSFLFDHPDPESFARQILESQDLELLAIQATVFSSPDDYQEVLRLNEQALRVYGWCMTIQEIPQGK